LAEYQSFSIEIMLIAAGSCSPLVRQTQKNHAFKQLLNHSDLNLIPRPGIFPVQPRTNLTQFIGKMH